MTYLVAAAALVAALQLFLLWRIWCAVSTLDEVTDECVRVSRTLHLLMETTESGFASFGGVLGEALQPLRRRKAAQTRSRTTVAAAPAPAPAPAQRPVKEPNPPVLSAGNALHQALHAWHEDVVERGA